MPEPEQTAVDRRKSFIDNCVKDSRGHLAIVAAPNVPIIVWVAARLLMLLLHGKAAHVAQLLAFGALFTWAWLELFQGVNYFRRALGLVVLVMLVLSTK